MTNLWTHWTKPTTFAENKWNVAEMLISVPGRTEAIVGKGENAGDHFPKCFLHDC